MQPFLMTFEQPSHGWLPLRIEAGGKLIEFAASDVPNNPVEELFDALFLVIRGESATVWWHLEPDGYYLHLEPEGANTVLRVTFAQQSARRRETEVLTVTAPTNRILLVLWRFLRRVEEAAFAKPYWRPVNFSGLEALGQRIKAEAEAEA